MPKILSPNVNKIIYGELLRNVQSDVFKFQLVNGGIDEILINSITFPPNVYGKLESDSTYTTHITTAFTIPQTFIPGNKYFMSTLGKIIQDETETGIYLGIGNINKNLDVKIQIGIQDELGFILEDEQGNFLEDV